MEDSPTISTDEGRHLAASAQSERKDSVYEDAISTPAMPSAGDSPRPATVDDQASKSTANGHQEDAAQRASSPTDHLHLHAVTDHHLNGGAGTAEATPTAVEFPRSNADDPTSVLIATLRLQNGDLHSQVDMLNSKLVSSYGRYGDLEEDLEKAHQERDHLKRTNDSLMQERQRWEARVEGGMLVEKAHVQDELTRMMDRVIEETAQRGKAETDKETIEKELDELSASLFGEANRMVAVEREARAAADVKSRSLEDRLRDTEGIINHQADQMKHLGTVIAAIERERDEVKAKLTSFEADPAFIAARDALPPQISDADPASGPPSPWVGGLLSSHHPRFPELLTDILPYHEFHIFIRHLHRLRINTLSRPHEPSGGNLQIALGSAPSSPDPQARLNDLLPLSQHLSQPFIKRCQEEDSDPTLRLDLAPGLTWLNRRSVAQAVTDGNLVIEPAYVAIPPTEKCALCGVSLERWLVDPNAASDAQSPSITGGQAAVRRLMGTQTWASQGWAKWAPKSLATSVSSEPSPPPSSQISPVHVFRTSDVSSTGSRYALCPNYCLPRLRSVCDLWTAIRNIERSLLLGERAPTQGLSSSLRPDSAISARKSLGIGTVSNLLRRTPSSEPKSAFTEAKSPPPTSNETSTVLTKEESQALDNTTQIVSEATPEVPDKPKLPPVSEATLKDGDDPPAATTVESTRSEEEMSSPKPPPLPKRSEARTPRIESPDPMSSALEPPALIRPTPIRHAPPPLKTDLSSAWEDKAWQDLVKLKEALFWTRMGIVTEVKP